MVDLLQEFFCLEILMKMVLCFIQITIAEKERRYTAEIRNKAFTVYCLALKCGVDQVDALPQNYLLGDDNSVTMIDFGEARPTKNPVSGKTTLQLIEDMETLEKTDARPDYTEFTKVLKRMNPKLSRWLLADNRVRLVKLPSFTKEKADLCLEGLFTPASNRHHIMEALKNIERFDAERNAQKLKEITRRANERREDAERDAQREEKLKAREECKKGNRGFCSVMGGTRKKRKTKRRKTRK